MSIEFNESNMYIFIRSCNCGLENNNILASIYYLS